MPDAYPLESLLSVRRFREEAAKRGVVVAQSQHKAAAEALERARAELEAWRAWKAAEVERRYDALIGSRVSIKALTAFNAGLAELADGELAKRMAVDDAGRALEAARKRIEEARRAVHTSRQNTAKIEAHKSLWSEDYKREVERAQEREFEDFKPVSRLGAGGDDA